MTPCADTAAEVTHGQEGGRRERFSGALRRFDKLPDVADCLGTAISVGLGWWVSEQQILDWGARRRRRKAP